VPDDKIGGSATLPKGKMSRITGIHICCRAAFGGSLYNKQNNIDIAVAYTDVGMMKFERKSCNGRNALQYG